MEEDHHHEEEGEHSDSNTQVTTFSQSQGFIWWILLLTWWGWWQASSFLKWVLVQYTSQFSIFRPESNSVKKLNNLNVRMCESSIMDISINCSWGWIIYQSIMTKCIQDRFLCWNSRCSLGSGILLGELTKSIVMNILWTSFKSC